MDQHSLALNPLGHHQRWFALEVGEHRYALDLASVRTMFYQPLSESGGDEGEATNLSSVFLNVRSVIVHEGAPVFLLSPSQLFSCQEEPLDARQYDSAESALTLPWVVILRGDSLSSVGLRVSRASGPFRLTDDSVTSDAQGSSPMITHGGQQWLAVRVRTRFVDSLYGDSA